MRIGPKVCGLLSILAVCAAAAPLHAGPIYSFANITHNHELDAALGEAQFFMEVVPDAGPAQVWFRFTNSGPAASSLTRVYFENGTLLGLADILGGPGVQFSAPATPANLPGGASITPAFVATAGFSAGSDPPVQPNGVNPGELLSIGFTLQPGRTYADVLGDLDSAALRVGIHVQGFASGGSESFLNVPQPPNLVPAPGAAALALLGAGLVDRLRRRRPRHA
jgi:hypothetical protein